MLTDFQGCEEQLVSEAQEGLRKHIVFESSSLANQQYDLQMLFKVKISATQRFGFGLFAAPFGIADAGRRNSLHA